MCIWQRCFTSRVSIDLNAKSTKKKNQRKIIQKISVYFVWATHYFRYNVILNIIYVYFAPIILLIMWSDTVVAVCCNKKKENDKKKRKNHFILNTDKQMLFNVHTYSLRPIAIVLYSSFPNICFSFTFLEHFIILFLCIDSYKLCLCNECVCICFAYIIFISFIYRSNI